jgi:predicted nucleotidyltransferase
MIFTKTEIRVLELFISRIADSFTIREVSRLIKKDLKIVYTSIKNLILKEFLLKEKNGLRINYKKNSEELAYIEHLRKEQFFKKHDLLKIYISDFLRKNKKKFFVLLVFGSYASGKETKKSDVDLLAILPSEDEAFERQLKASLANAPQDFHVTFITEESFREMLSKRDQVNAVNETLNNHMILYGAEQYYSLVGERDVR